MGDDDSIGEYYARIERQRKAAWADVEAVRALIAAGDEKAALALIEEKLGKLTFNRKVRRLFAVSDQLIAGLRLLRDRAHNAGNTGD